MTYFPDYVHNACLMVKNDNYGALPAVFVHFAD